MFHLNLRKINSEPDRIWTLTSSEGQIGERLANEKVLTGEDQGWRAAEEYFFFHWQVAHQFALQDEWRAQILSGSELTFLRFR